MKRVVTKIGDIFSVPINDKSKKYFQLIAFDLTQLNSDVIRSFKKEYPINVDPDLEEVVNSEVQFYAHCVTKWGVKLGYWGQVGKSNYLGDLSHVLFRDTNDYGEKEYIEISHKWYVWHINDPDFVRVGNLEGENRKAEIGMVMSPANVVHRIRTGEYNLPFYPRFE